MPLNDGEFVELWNRFKGHCSDMARHLGLTDSAVYQRARRLEGRGHRLIRKDSLKQVPPELYVNASKARISTTLNDGVVVVGSDAHIWPGEETTAMRSFLKLIPELKPKQVHMNGDVFDGAKISRHPKIGFLEKAPDVRDEMKACQKAMEKIEKASGRAKLFWEFGNHDLRFEAYLAAHVPQFEGMEGFHLKDWFPKWNPAWRVDINPDTTGHTIIKHRFKGGKYDAPNNVVNAGVNIVTGHTHAMKVWPSSDARKHTTYGVNSGTLAEPYSDQFVHYTEDNPMSWRAGWVCLTFWNGLLLPPEMCQVIDEGLVVFRGQVIKV